MERNWSRWLIGLVTPRLSDTLCAGTPQLMHTQDEAKVYAVYGDKEDGTVRRPRVLNQVAIPDCNPPGLEGCPRTPPPTPDARTTAFEKRQAVKPSLATLERAASNALFFEQYYDSLARPLPRRRRLASLSAQAFAVGRVIGQGAFGVVYIAEEVASGRIVAIKQLRKTDLLRMGQEGHVRAEKDLLAAAACQDVEYTWIPRLHCAFQDADHLFLVLEYMGGGDLLTLLMARGSLPESAVRFYAAEMVLALHQTHTLGYIHRDVKPDNFLFTSEGHIRVADFGLATDLHWSHDSSYYEHQRRALLKRHGVPLSRPAFGNRRRRVETPAPSGERKRIMSWRRHRRRLAYTICGTNSYMAPEVIRGQGYGFSADWWGLGIIVYEALYGSVPFVGGSRQAAREKILNWKNSLKFPSAPRASALAVDFVKQLLCEPEDRLGYTTTSRRRGSGAASASASASASVEGPLGSDGVAQLMAHPWFAGIDWARIHLEVPPYQPNLASEDDTRHFDEDIPDEPLAPANSALDLRDPLLGDASFGAEVMAIRKNLAFKGWTFRAPDDGEAPPDPSWAALDPDADADAIDEMMYYSEQEGPSTPATTRENHLSEPAGYVSDTSRYVSDVSGALDDDADAEDESEYDSDGSFDRDGQLVRWQDILVDDGPGTFRFSAYRRKRDEDGEGTVRASDQNTVRGTSKDREAARARAMASVPWAAEAGVARA